MLIHCILLLIRIESSIFHFTFGFSIVGSLLLLLASYVLNFCALHRLFIIYDFIMEIKYEKVKPTKSNSDKNKKDTKNNKSTKIIKTRKMKK